MPKPKWTLSSPDSNGSLGGPIYVYDKADLDRRLAEAEKAGVTTSVRVADE